MGKWGIFFIYTCLFSIYPHAADILPAQYLSISMVIGYRIINYFRFTFKLDLFLAIIRLDLGT